MITLLLPPPAADRCRAITSPLLETVLSLQTLVDPRRHAGQHAFIRRSRKMPRALRSEIRAFSFCLKDYFPAFFFPRSGSSDFADEIAELEHIEAAAAAFELTRSLGGRLPRDQASLGNEAYRTMILQNARERFPDSEATVGTAIEDPARVLERLIELLGSYWDYQFAAEWHVRQDGLEAERAAFTAALPSGGIVSTLSRAEPVLTIDLQRHAVSLRRHHHHEVDVSVLPSFLFIASDFVWPDCRISCDAPWTGALVYPTHRALNSRTVVAPTESLARSAQALSDPVRLAILRLSAGQARSTQQLAGLLNLAESTTSEHLRTLRQAGLLRRTRRGYYVLYETNISNFEHSVGLLADYVIDDPLSHQ